VKRFAELPELNGFPRLRLLNSIDELAPLPLVISDPPSLSDVTAKRSQNRRSIPTDEEIKLLLARHRNSENGALPKLYTKKSQQTGYKSLKKFNTSGSRNCFFSPVQVSTGIR
jgi:hypothetical protein